MKRLGLTFVCFSAAACIADAPTALPSPLTAGKSLELSDEKPLFLHGSGGSANPSTLYMDAVAPAATTPDYLDSPSIKFAGGNPWKEVGSWASDPTSIHGTITAFGDARLWVGLRNSDDQGTRFDVRVEAYRNGALFASGEELCVQNVVRNANQAKEVVVGFAPMAAQFFNGSTDVVSITVLTRIGTTEGGAACGGHGNAVGLRTYFDATSRPARLTASVLAPVASIVVTPASTTITVGQTVQLAAILNDANGNFIYSRAVAWASSGLGASVDASGLVTGMVPGTYTIIAATSEGVSGAAQVTVASSQCTALGNQALGFWPFEEGTGLTTADHSGNGHTGNLQGTTAWISGANDAGNAMDFNNPQDLVNVGPFITTPVAQLSVGAWVYPTSFSNLGDILVGGSSGPRIISATDESGWAVGHAPGNGKIQVELRGISSFILNTELPLNVWSNVMVVYDGASVKTYLNGALVDNRAAPAATVRQASSCTFIGNEPEACGRQTNGNFAWQGRIDEVVAYDRALTNPEVLALYRRCVFDLP